MARYEVPLSPAAQRFRIQIVETLYTLRVHWADAPEGGWLLDLADDNVFPTPVGMNRLTATPALQPG